jgi:hypothetical protein
MHHACKRSGVEAGRANCAICGADLFAAKRSEPQPGGAGDMSTVKRTALRTIGVILILLALFAFVPAILGLAGSPNISRAIGTFIPGAVLGIIGLWLLSK